MIVGFAYPARKYRGYNFQTATVSVSLLSAFNTKGNCFSVPELVNSKVHTVIENEVVFRASQGGEAGLGNDKDQHIYRTFHNRSCYEIQVSIALSQFANFDPGTIKEFKPSDQQEVYGSLNRVIYTLRFLK